MPTALPRVSVTISEEQFGILSRMGKLQRRPASSFIRELLDAAMPALRAMLPVLEARERTLAEQPEALQRAAQELLDAFSGMDPDQLSLLDITEDDLKDLATATPPGDQREPGEGSGAERTAAKRGRTAPNPPRTTATARRNRGR
jgi:hypothetical protein